MQICDDEAQHKLLFSSVCFLVSTTSFQSSILLQIGRGYFLAASSSTNIHDLFSLNYLYQVSVFISCSSRCPSSSSQLWAWLSRQICSLVGSKCGVCRIAGLSSQSKTCVGYCRDVQICAKSCKDVQRVAEMCKLTVYRIVHTRICPQVVHPRLMEEQSATCNQAPTLTNSLQRIVFTLESNAKLFIFLIFCNSSKFLFL